MCIEYARTNDCQTNTISMYDKRLNVFVTNRFY